MQSLIKWALSNGIHNWGGSFPAIPLLLKPDVVLFEKKTFFFKDSHLLMSDQKYIPHINNQTNLSGPYGET